MLETIVARLITSLLTGGCYGATVYQYLLGHGYPMWLIENALTRHMREKIMGDIPKTDETDARVMARICYLHEAVGEEFKLRPLRLAEPEEANLLALCRDSWKPNQMVVRERNQFTQLMAVIFPELKTFFTKSVSSLAPVSLVAAYPTPADLVAASAEEVRAVLWRVGAYHHARRLDELQELARHTSGPLPEPGRAWRLNWLTSLLLNHLKAQTELNEQVEALVTRHPTMPGWRGHRRLTARACRDAAIGISSARTFRLLLPWSGSIGGRTHTKHCSSARRPPGIPGTRQCRSYVQRWPDTSITA